MALINLAGPASGTLAPLRNSFNRNVVRAMWNTLGNFDFQDSEVADIGLHGADMVIRFSAAQVHRPAEAGGGAAYLQSVELICMGAWGVQQEAACLGRLSSGVLRVNGLHCDRLPVPWEVLDPVELVLTFANGAACHARAVGVALKPVGEPRFVEWLTC